jgi:ribonuclease E
MSKELCISSTPHETRLAIIEDDQLTEIYYERENEYTLAGSIYKGRVTRVLPGMQSAFVDVGLERDAFLYVTDFLEEAGEAADFEKPNGGGRRENRPPREPRVASENGNEPGRPDSRSSEGRNEGGRNEGGRNQQRGEGRSEGRSENRADNRGEARIQVEPVAADEAPSALRSATPGAATDSEFDQGTRKWRGRRGRRRGFRGGQREGAAPAPTITGTTDAASDLDENFHDEPASPSEAAAGMPISASTEPDFTPRPSFATTPTHSRQVHQESSSKGDKSSRGESSSRRESSSRNDSGAKPSFLPGESLSKYGHQPAAETTAPVASPAPKAQPLSTSRPSTIVEGVVGWDGVSAALPGESLSRHKNRPGQTAVTEPVAERVAEPAHHEAAVEAAHFDPYSSDSHIEDRTAASTSAQAEEHDWSAAEDASTTHAAPLEILHAVHTADGVTFEEVQQHTEPPSLAPLDETFSPQPAALEMEEVESEPVPAISAAHDFEPESASASYRINSAPSEYRVASPVEEAADVAPSPEPSASQEMHSQAMQDFFSETPIAYAEQVEFLSEGTAEEIHPFHAAAAVESAHPDLSHAAHAEATHEEGAEQEGAEAEEDAAHPVEQLHAFAPGHGVLEEETIDEEEYDFTPLHGHSDEHDLEEIEEETVDNTMVGSQLGDLVRDEHIQRRVSGDGDLEEDEFDESETESGAYTATDSDEDESDESVSAADEAHARAEAGGAFTEEDFATDSAAYAIGAGNEAEAGTVPAPRRDDNRRSGRNNERGGRRGSGQRGRSGGGHRHSAQTSDLPIISDLLKQGQEVLVQIAKEPIAKKGARITSHIALPGRFLVFMPTVNHVGVSRKISSDEERLRLKRVLTSEKGTAPGGFIVRTAADGASEEELRADLRFLISLWTEIKQRSDTGKSPALIYHDLNLVERILRDQVSDNFSTIWVDSEQEYERIVRFLNRFEPTLVRRVKLYTKETPLFEQFGIQEEISKALKSKVWLKSGGSIVINQTEALVAIDINTGKYVGKTARLEDTIVKTNLDAIPEIVRQIRLRDLGGIIIIDFIDMDERKNRNRVMAALEEALKADRAPSKVLQFNDFGLVAITRKRVKQSLERTLSTQCEICAGTGMVKSPITVCNEIYTELRKMQKHFERGDVLLRVHPEIVKALKANNGKWLSELEEMIGRTIIVKSDPALHPEQFDIH